MSAHRLPVRITKNQRRRIKNSPKPQGDAEYYCQQYPRKFFYRQTCFAEAEYADESGKQAHTIICIVCFFEIIAAEMAPAAGADIGIVGKYQDQPKEYRP